MLIYAIKRFGVALLVAELVNGYMSAGSYPVVWDASELSSGVYMVHMISGDYSTMQKVMLIK